MQPKLWIKRNAPILLRKNIVIVTPELKSFKVRSGGLGPAVEELAKALAEFNLKVHIVTPLYRRFFKGREPVEVDYSDIFLKDMGEVNIRVSGGDAKTKIKMSHVGKALVYFLENEKYADILYFGDMLKQCIFLARGTLEVLKKFKIKPSIVHLNDGHTGLVPFFMKFDPRYSQNPLFEKTKFVLTIHNAGTGYQQIFELERYKELEVDERYRDFVTWNGKMNLLYTALNLCDRCNTVSKDYEVTLKYDGEGLTEVFWRKKLFNIVNGIDVDYWRNPELKDKKKITKEMLKKIKQRAKRKLIKVIEERTGKKLKESELIAVMPRRLAGQKGFDVLMPHIHEICKPVKEGGLGFQIISLGVAHPWDPVGNEWAREFERLSKEISGFVFIYGFDEELAKLMYWGGDLIIYPSVPNKEPCGTGYMMAAVNGTPALATKTGGIVEKITEFNPILEIGDGFLVWEEEYSPEAFFEKMKFISYLYYKKPKKWLAACFNAFNMYVDIMGTAMEYISRLYKPLFTRKPL